MVPVAASGCVKVDALPSAMFVTGKPSHSAPEAVTGVEVTSQGAAAGMDVLVDQRIDVRGYPYYWISFKALPTEHQAPTDLWALGQRAISVTPIRLDLTDQAARDRLKHVFR